MRTPAQVIYPSAFGAHCYALLSRSASIAALDFRLDALDFSPSSLILERLDGREGALVLPYEDALAVAEAFALGLAE